MRLTEAQLRKQFDRTAEQWGWVRAVEADNSVPPFLLFALGSRETNLKNVLGDGGHGHGIWQRDDRSFDVPDDYLEHPLEQARDAARLLFMHFDFFKYWPKSSQRPWLHAVCAYNAGRTGVRRAVDRGESPDAPTAHGDYGSDVMERWTYFVRWGWHML